MRPAGPSSPQRGTQAHSLSEHARPRQQQDSGPHPLEAHTVVTPLRASSIAYQLRAHPDQIFAQALVSDIQEGARIGYTGPRATQHSRNLRSSAINPSVITQILRKECAEGRMAGPYQNPPCPKLHCSGVSLIPKKSGAMRMITHLSAPAGQSVNDFISRDSYSLRYATVDNAIAMIQRHGRGALMAKTDVKHTFRLIPVHPLDWPLLGIKWENQYYVDKCLPFGLRTLPFCSIA